MVLTKFCLEQSMLNNLLFDNKKSETNEFLEKKFFCQIQRNFRQIIFKSYVLLKLENY